MALAFAIPRIESKFTTPDGSVSRDWYLFLSAVLQTIGGDNVVPGGGIAPIDVQRQFEEYAVTSIEAVEAQRGVNELRAEMERGESPRIHDLLNIVDELRNELANSRSQNDRLYSLIEEQAARISDLPTNDLRQRVEAIEGRLA